MIDNIDSGLIFEGWDTPRADILAQARRRLLTLDTHHIDADEMLASAPVRRAWWGGDEHGFVHENHDDAAPVTVVCVVLPHIAAAHDARHVVQAADDAAAMMAAREKKRQAEQLALTRFPEQS